MKIWFGQGCSPDFPQGAAVTIGNFDGVHIGHRHILRRLREEAKSRNLPVVVVIF
ncbi:adenylyltransferase/cytidyltransferase family protein, partial [Neisseria elongata]